MFWNIVHAVYRWFVNFSGSVFVIFSIVSMVMVLAEMVYYRTKRSRAVRRIAVITGASSGLGSHFAHEIDTKEKNIDEIWLVARREDKLTKLALKLRHASRVLPLDLTKKECIDDLEEAIRESGMTVGILINCAGLGKIGNYAAVTPEDCDRMIELNDRAAVDVTNLCLPYMEAGSRIIEICSTASFQPLQHFNVYAATKAFLYSYSRALRMELLPKRIVVTAACPYWMKDTEFIKVARKTKAEDASPIRHFPFSTSSDKVAKRIMRASRAGFAVSTPGIFCTVHRFFEKLLPRESMMLFWEGLRRV